MTPPLQLQLQLQLQPDKEARQPKEEEEEEAIIWILDAAHTSMNTAFHHDGTTRFECMKQVAHDSIQDSIRKPNVQMSVLVLEKTNHRPQLQQQQQQQQQQQKASDSFLEEETKKPPPQPVATTIGILQQSGRSDPATKQELCQTIQSLQITHKMKETTTTTTDNTDGDNPSMDFGTGLLLATETHWNQYCREISVTSKQRRIRRRRQRRRRRIILLTDAEHKLDESITKNPTQILIALDRLRTMKCSLQVVGFDFQTQAEFEQPAQAKTTCTHVANENAVSNQNDNDSSEDDDDDDDSKSGTDDSSSGNEAEDEDEDEDENKALIKRQNEQFLVGLAQKTGGFVMSPNDMKSVQERLSKPLPTIPDDTQSLNRPSAAKRPLEVIDIYQQEEDLKAKRLFPSRDDTDDDDDDDEVQVLSPPPRAPATSALHPPAIDDSPGVAVAWSNMTNPNVDYPHKRVDCGVYRFNDDDDANREAYCEKCYCVVCDVPARDCPSWREHCKERPKLAQPEVEVQQHQPSFQDFLSQAMEQAGMSAAVRHPAHQRQPVQNRAMFAQLLLEQFFANHQETHDGDDDDSDSDKDKENDDPSSLRLSPGFRYHWDGSDGVSLDAWLRQIRPSQCSSNDCAWIQVANTNPSSPGYSHESRGDRYNQYNQEAYMPALNVLTDIIQAGRRVPAREKQACVQSLLATAQSQNNTVGKWMLFLSPGVADEVWRTVARATANGTLGCSAKIGPAKGIIGAGGVVCCCVYVQDCTCRPEVQRVLRALQTDLGLTIKCGFKPDFYTDLGIYQQNPWRLKPVLYTVKEVLEW
jgi:hypothetical protein